MTSITITSIAERPDLAPIVAGWVWDAFWPGNAAKLPALNAMIAGAVSVAGPPQCFVALVDGVPAGTVSLVVSDLDERPTLTPWLALVFILPAWRGRGLSQPLLAAVDHACVTAGIGTLWLYTNTAEQLYARAGWRAVEVIERPGKNAIVLMSKQMDPAR